MAHPHHDDARKAHKGKMNVMGVDGEYPPDRAARIADVPDASENARGDAARAPDEVWNWAPARQVSNYGKAKE